MKNKWGPDYVGCTQLSMEMKAAEWESHAPWYFTNYSHLRGCVPQRLHQRPLPHKVALCLEVVETVTTDSLGACYAQKRVSPEQRSEIHQLKQGLQGCRSLVEKIRTVGLVAKTTCRDGPLNRHIRNECFKCGESYGSSCQCKTGSLQSDASKPIPRKRQSGRNTVTGAFRRRWIMKLSARDEEYRKHKWGPNWQANRKRLNKKYVPRKSKSQQ